MEQPEAVAVATNFTDVPTVLLLEGLVTVTPANADIALKRHAKIAIVIEADFVIVKINSRRNLVETRVRSWKHRRSGGQKIREHLWV